MTTDALSDRPISLSTAEDWIALGGGGLLLLLGASRRDALGALLAISSAPLLYRGITGQWPARVNGDTPSDSTTRALGGERRVHVRESIRLEPILLDRIERGEIDPSFIITHRIGLEDAPAMYRTFRDKHDSCIKVVMKPGEATRDKAKAAAS